MRQAKQIITDKGSERDLFEWIGVAVDVVQAVLYAAAVVAALYWYVLRDGGMPAVVVALALMVGALLACVTYLLFVLRSMRKSALPPERRSSRTA